MSKSVIMYKMKPAIVYGSETWPMTETDMKIVNTWERKLLRSIYEPEEE
jgi:hypothetical protein